MGPSQNHKFDRAPYLTFPSFFSSICSSPAWPSYAGSVSFSCFRLWLSIYDWHKIKWPSETKPLSLLTAKCRCSVALKFVVLPSRACPVNWWCNHKRQSWHAGNITDWMIDLYNECSKCQPPVLMQVCRRLQKLVIDLKTPLYEDLNMFKSA